MKKIIKYKSYREQGRECLYNHNIFYEECICCGHTLIMCKKYGGQCSSNKCLNERKGEELCQKD